MTQTVLRVSLLGPLLLAAIAGADEIDLADRETFFELKIRPILVSRCFKCHGGEKESSGLRVDSRQRLLEGGDRGPALAPGKPDDSLMMRAIRHVDEELQMPPQQPLPETVIADFAQWIHHGAFWSTWSDEEFQFQRHWAFVPVTRPNLPPDPDRWADGPVDPFVMNKLRAAGLKPNKSADKRTLIRRATFDLIGLPPTPEQIETFLADNSPYAFARVVDRLLASAHYGERWGRHWLDLARYADTAGDSADYPIPEAYLYRDYVVNALNDDMPYDRFLREQIAGDILAAGDPDDRYAEQVVATGFIALSRRFSSYKYGDMHLTIGDTIYTLGRAVLGMTMRCARCHDHKFDPITTQDYYALYGVLASTQYPATGYEKYMRPLFMAPLHPPDQVNRRLQPYHEEIQQLEAEMQKVAQEQEKYKRLQEVKQDLTALVEEISTRHQQGEDIGALRATLADVEFEWLEATSLVDEPVWPIKEKLIKLERAAGVERAYAVEEGEPRDVRIQIGGDPYVHGALVQRGVPKFLKAGIEVETPPDSSGRLQLAEWLVDERNPLTARVIVNRIWRWHFGRGLVDTPSNFGLRGSLPTHPELLDWLASELVDHGWSIKHLHRRIMLSKTYQLASTVDETSAAIDEANKWYWRFNRQRLDAESIRDSMLAVSGNLDLQRPGPHPFPPIEQWEYRQGTPFDDVSYPSNHRSIYLMSQRNHRHPYLTLFDGADPNESTGTRDVSTVPLQALYLMNSPFVRQQAEALVRRVMAAAEQQKQRLAVLYELAFGRQPTPDDCQEALDYLEKYKLILRELADEGDTRESEAWNSFVALLLASNEFIYID